MKEELALYVPELSEFCFAHYSVSIEMSNKTLHMSFFFFFSLSGVCVCLIPQWFRPPLCSSRSRLSRKPNSEIWLTDWRSSTSHTSSCSPSIQHWTSTAQSATPPLVVSAVFVCVWTWVDRWMFRVTRLLPRQKNRRKLIRDFPLVQFCWIIKVF